MDKLRIDEEGKYYQDRMRTEREKRISYSESRRQNRIKKEDNICKTYDIHMENENINININKDNKEKESVREKEKLQFDEFRKNFPGTKRGNEIEFQNFIKKHKDWKDILPVLLKRLDYQKDARQVRKENKLFVPEWKNLQTWINQRCWEDIINTNE
jgi:hypothetical protein